MNYAVIDVETTISNDGNPFDRLNKLCCIGIKDSRGCSVFPIEYEAGAPYGDTLRALTERIESVDFLVGFNIKFDLHWIRRYVPGIRWPDLVFDCMLAEFILGNQKEVFPSLDGTCERRNLGRKLDVVRMEYWERGIDTPQVPWDLLAEYCEHDLQLTDVLFKLQKDDLARQGKRQLFALQCRDLLVLQEMEFNGLRYDLNGAALRGNETRLEIQNIDKTLEGIIPGSVVNWNSDDHISCVLYGGTIYERYRESYQRTLKDGTVKDKERWGLRPVDFPILVKPIPKTETKPTSAWNDNELDAVNQQRVLDGKTPFCRHWSTAEPILRKLRLRGKAQQIVELLLKRSELEKLDSTYYSGLVEFHAQKNWNPDEIHGQFNQVVATTSRLSSSGPNLQNFASILKDLFYSRYGS